jgi:hypothetical protein
VKGFELSAWNAEMPFIIDEEACSGKDARIYDDMKKIESDNCQLWQRREADME